MIRHVSLLTVFLIALIGAAIAVADDTDSQQAQSGETPSQEQLFKQFQETLSGADLVGHFTVLGKENLSPRQERYTIQSIEKLPAGDLWLFKARIKYGDKDFIPPAFPLQVKWAGDTPIITLTDLAIPALGTFSARVVIYNGKYAGTWTHGQTGGHLFGVIEKTAEEESIEPATDESDP